MFTKKEVADFFDRCAPFWDEISVENSVITEEILDNARIEKGMDVLDVACGTGVMFGYYLKRGAAFVTGIDISPVMAEIAAKKYSGRPEIRVIAGDVETAVFDRKFDAAVVYNALPHFADPARLISALSRHLRKGGTLSIAHGASREEINACHAGEAEKISNGLMSAGELKELFSAHFEAVTVISDERMYQVTGVRK